MLQIVKHFQNQEKVSEADQTRERIEVESQKTPNREIANSHFASENTNVMTFTPKRQKGKTRPIA